MIKKFPRWSAVRHTDKVRRGSIDITLSPLFTFNHRLFWLNQMLTVAVLTVSDGQEDWYTN